MLLLRLSLIAICSIKRKEVITMACKGGKGGKGGKSKGGKKGKGECKSK